MKQDARRIAEFVDCDAITYHSDKSRLSHSQLETFIDSPELYYGRHITGEWPQESTDAMDFGTVVHDLILGPQVKFGPTNYRPRTIACFTPCELTRAHRRATPDFVSKTGSSYWLHADGVTRESDHWGQCATCYWALRTHGQRATSSTDIATGFGPWPLTAGFCRWEHFLPARSFLPIPPAVLASNGAKSTNAWRDFEKANPGSILMKESQFEGVPWMLEKLREHPRASKLLTFDGGRNEQTIHWTDEENGTALRSRLDLLTLVCIGDYKTCNSVDQREFAAHAWSMGYFRQAAFYVDAVKQLTGDELRFVFIAQLKKPPYSVETFVVDDDSLAIARQQNREALDWFAACKQSNSWLRKGHGNLVTLSAPKYAFYQ